MQFVHMRTRSVALPTYTVDDFGTLIQLTSFAPLPDYIESCGIEFMVPFSTFYHATRDSQFEGE